MLFKGKNKFNKQSYYKLGIHLYASDTDFAQIEGMFVT